MADMLTPDDLGLTAPSMVPPPIPQAPGLNSFLPKPTMADHLAPLVAAIGAALLGPKHGGAGLAAGVNQGYQRERQNDLVLAQAQENDAIRQQTLAQQNQQRQMQLDQERNNRLMAAKTAIRQQVAAIKDPTQYDQAINSYANILMQSGYRVTPNQLRIDAPFVAPSAKQIAADAVNAWLKNPANAAAVKKDPSIVGKVTLRIDTNGDGVPENVPLVRAGDIGGIQFATDESGQVLGTAKTDQPIGDPFKQLLKAKQARFLADNKREPTPQEQEQMVTEAMKAAREKPEKPAVLVPVKTVENGRVVTKFVEKHAGDSYEAPPSAVTQNRLDSAQTVQQTGEDIIRQLSDPKIAAQVGPLMGRYNNLREFLGSPPPELSELAGEIESYALASMGVHGMRSANGAAQINAMLDKRHTPESLAGTIRGLNKFSQTFLMNSGRTLNQPTGTTEGPAESPDAAILAARKNRKP